MLPAVQYTRGAITAAADVAPRTFFSYFRSKDDLLFADFDPALELMRAGFAARPAEEGPADALHRIATQVLPQATDHLLGKHADIRRRLLLSRPELAARAVQCMQEAERELAAQLHGAFPDHLSELQQSRSPPPWSRSHYAASKTASHPTACTRN